MKEWEAYKLSRETGAKIRGKKWSPHLWVQWDEFQQKWVKNDNAQWPALDWNHDWEEYKPSIPTFNGARAMYWLQKGYSVRKGFWPKGAFIRKLDEDLVDESSKIYLVSEWFDDLWYICDLNGAYVIEPHVHERIA